MSKQKPDVTDEDIGMRTFQLRREAAVERSLDRMRQGLKQSWEMFTKRDLDDLSWIIGELWAFEKRAEWEDLHFGKLTAEDVFEIIQLARRLRKDSQNTVETLVQAGDMVRARSV